MGVSTQSTWESLLNRNSVNMNRFVGFFALVAVAMGAPAPEAGVYATGALAAAPLAAGAVAGGAVVAGGSYAGAPVVSAPAVVGQTHQTYAAGAPTVQQHTEYGIVGHQVVQTGTQSVVAGHQYAVAGVEHVPQPSLPPQHLWLPSPLHPGTLDLPPLTLSPSRR